MGKIKNPVIKLLMDEGIDIVEKIEFYKKRYGTLNKACQEFARAIERNYNVVISPKTLDYKYRAILGGSKSYNIETPKELKTEIVSPETDLPLKDETSEIVSPEASRIQSALDNKNQNPTLAIYWDFVNMPKLIKYIEREIKAGKSKKDLMIYFSKLYGVSFAAFNSKYNYYKEYVSPDVKEKGSYRLSGKETLLDTMQTISEVDKEIMTEYDPVVKQKLQVKKQSIISKLFSGVYFGSKNR